MICLDSSVAIAGFGQWHERHADARAVMRERPGIASHASLETYSVLTRLPAPARAPADVVREFLRRQFPEPFALSEKRQQGLVAELAAAGIAGGAVYDGVIAITAVEAEATLLTFDRRALATYLRCGASAGLLD